MFKAEGVGRGVESLGVEHRNLSFRIKGLGLRVRI
jgi:hypothetical protein